MNDEINPVPQDDLKGFIAQQRAAFEQPLPEGYADALWADVDAQLARKKRKHVVYYALRIAAAVVLCIVVGASWFTYSTQQNDWATLPDEFLETELYYQQRIEEKMRQLKTLPVTLSPHFQENMAQLDSIYAELQHDLRDKTNRAEVIEAMIAHQRLKLTLLEHILETLEEENHETTTPYDL